MARRFIATIGCPGCGCGGLFVGAAIAATLLSHAYPDDGSKSFAILLYSGQS